LDAEERSERSEFLMTQENGQRNKAKATPNRKQRFTKMILKTLILCMLLLLLCSGDMESNPGPVLSTQDFNNFFNVVDVPPHGNCFLLAVILLLPTMTLHFLRHLISSQASLQQAFDSLGGFSAVKAAMPSAVSLKVYNSDKDEMEVIVCESLEEFAYHSQQDRTYVQVVHISVVSDDSEHVGVVIQFRAQCSRQLYILLSPSTTCTTGPTGSH